MRQFGLKTAIQFYGRPRAVKTVNVHSDDSSNRLHESDHFAQVNWLPELSFRERKRIAQRIIRRSQNLFRFVIRVDFDFAGNPEEGFLIRNRPHRHERIARGVNRRDEIGD